MPKGKRPSASVRKQATKYGVNITTPSRKSYRVLSAIKSEIARKKKSAVKRKPAKKKKPIPSWGKSETLTGARVLGSKGGKKSAMLRRKKKLGIMGRGCPPYGGRR